MFKIFTPTPQLSTPTLRFVCDEGRAVDESRLDSVGRETDQALKSPPKLADVFGKV